MKIILICFLLASLSALAAEKKTAPDMREGTKSVDEKYLKTFGGENQDTKPTTQSRVHQIESKKSRQFQEENPRSHKSQ